MPVLDVNKLIDDRANAIADYHRATGITRAELDISGGVDSAVMLGLLAKALGPDKITAVHSRIHSSDDALARARAVCARYDVPLVEIDLTDLFEELTALMRTSLIAAGTDAAELDALLAADPTILGSIRSTIRAPLGRGFNRMTAGGIRHGTGNECEDRWLRFFQKGGDGEVDTNPIAMLSKGEVFQLGRGLEVPRSILEAIPSPDLWGTGEGHSDEAELASITGVALTYSRVDLDNGDYTHVGTIEAISRLADRVEADVEAGYHHPDFFDGAMPESKRAAIVELAGGFPGLSHLDGAGARALFDAAWRFERVTRHKMNPNCPILGSRAPLLKAGVLTEALPRL